MRIERDFLGEVEINDDVLYGINTYRALQNFGINNFQFDRDLIQSYFYVKLACAKTNKELGYLNSEIADAIIDACNFFLSLENYKDIVPINPYMGGAGTSLNMNINEVIANKALEYLGKEYGDYSVVDPIEHVNLHQSTNDTFPTAVKIATIIKLRRLSTNIEKLQGVLQKKEIEFEENLKIGRTELQEATPVTLGKEFSAFADAIGRDRWRVFKCEERIKSVNLGGTSIGTGLAAPRDYILKVVDNLRELTSLPIARAENLVDATANSDAFVEVSGILNANGVNISKICNDLRLMNMLKEIELPKLQKGSSIMPTKVNPVICEYAIQISMKIKANDLIINDTASRATFQINEFLPMLSFALMESLELLIDVTDRVAKYIEKTQAKSEEHFENSKMVATVLVPYIGYSKVEDLIKEFDKMDNSYSFIDFLKQKFGKEFVDQHINPYSITKLGYKK